MGFPLEMLVCIEFQGLFHYCFATLFQLSLTVLFHYRSILVFSLLILAMSSSNRRFYFFSLSLLSYRTFTFFGFLSSVLCDWLFEFHSPLLSESLLISFPPITKMFQFTGFSWSFEVFFFPPSPPKGRGGGLLRVLLGSTFLFLIFHIFYDPFLV